MILATQPAIDAGDNRYVIVKPEGYAAMLFPVVRVPYTLLSEAERQEARRELANRSTKERT